MNDVSEIEGFLQDGHQARWSSLLAMSREWIAKVSIKSGKRFSISMRIGRIMLVSAGRGIFGLHS